MEGKDGLDVLPLGTVRRNTRTAFHLRLGDHEVYQTQTFGFGNGLVLEGLGDVIVGARGADAVEPVLETGSVDLLGEEVGGCDFDEDEER